MLFGVSDINREQIVYLSVRVGGAVPRIVRQADGAFAFAAHGLDVPLDGCVNRPWLGVLLWPQRIAD